MATSFQPEKPYEKAQGGGGSSSYLWVALIAALFVMMLFALGIPRAIGLGSGSWLVTIAAGIVTFLVIYLVGARRGRNNQSVAE